MGVTMDELEIIEPTQTIVRAGGEELVISEMNVRQMKSFIKKMNDISLYVRDRDVDVRAMFITNPDLVTDMVSICIGKSVDWIDEIKVDELIVLAFACVEVNADFFMTRVLPIFNSAMERLSKKLGGLNSTSPLDATVSEAS